MAIISALSKFNSGVWIKINCSLTLIAVVCLIANYLEKGFWYQGTAPKDLRRSRVFSGCCTFPCVNGVCIPAEGNDYKCICPNSNYYGTNCENGNGKYFCTWYFTYMYTFQWHCWNKLEIVCLLPMFTKNTPLAVASRCSGNSPTKWEDFQSITTGKYILYIKMYLMLTYCIHWI